MARVTSLGVSPMELSPCYHPLDTSIEPLFFLGRVELCRLLVRQPSDRHGTPWSGYWQLVGLSNSLHGRQCGHSHQDRPSGWEGPGKERDRDENGKEGAGDGGGDVGDAQPP